MKMAEVLSGCAVRAVIQVEKATDDAHYLEAIRIRLEQLYELTEEPNLREQISDEIDWVNEKLGEWDKVKSEAHNEDGTMSKAFFGLLKTMAGPL
jgi:hypothetical protein